MKRSVTALAVYTLLCGTRAHTQDFSTDPGWIGLNNTPSAVPCATTKQDFGFDPVKRAVGGVVTRSTVRASYGAPVTVNLDSRLSARGVLTVGDSDNGGLYIGWFNSGSSPANFLGMRLTVQGSVAATVYADLWAFTNTNRGFGTKFSLPLPPGPVYWQVDYEPGSSNGRGAARLIIGSQAPLFLELPDGFRRDGAIFNRFGMSNVNWSAGATITAHLDDVSFTGQPGTNSFLADPGWSGTGNRTSFTDCGVRPNQQFGWNSQRRAVGGPMFRVASTANATTYARPSVASLNEKLVASGTLTLTNAMVDSATLIGWFNSSSIMEPWPRGFIGLLIEGPTVDGHLVKPMYVTNAGTLGILTAAPRIVPNNVPHVWRLTYDPTAGSLSLLYDGATYAFTIPPSHRAEGATMDRFGLSPLRYSDGGPIELYIDDVSLTVEGADPYGEWQPPQPPATQLPTVEQQRLCSAVRTSWRSDVQRCDVIILYGTDCAQSVTLSNVTPQVCGVWP